MRLQELIRDLKTSESKKDLMKLIATSYSWGAPRDIVNTTALE